MKHIIHITHNDGDAIGCALVAQNLYSDSDIMENTYFCSIGTTDDKINELLEEGIPDALLISDIAISEEMATKLEQIHEESGMEILGIDHHQTNKLCENHDDWWIINSGKVLDEMITNEYTTISAAEILLKVFKESSYTGVSPVLEKLIKMISRYDTWNWRYFPYSWDECNITDDVVPQICQEMGAYNCYNAIKDMYKQDINGDVIATEDNMVPDYFLTLYDIHKRNEERYFKTLEVKCKVTIMHELVYAIIFCENNVSNAAAEYIYNTYDFVDVVVIVYMSSGQIGLRTCKPDIDVSELAKVWKGGGHPKAAGTDLPPTEMLALSATYLLKAIPIGQFDAARKEKMNANSEAGYNSGTNS